ncbi:uncharacterized protein THITE_2114100 [Thermothielavioides terrestris NRRL 8126]|uniref:Uncharacterized protein n=1 Tax=Thermothielavioides terrestris (strain ATCC 38088 / NRRL 8126) TaxID=578455 RepID=G2QY86_THETT|nr:uncharacterized protein THITE_2114100 [Thermothielavioides terrestris NRRL 8126]AEO66184.1 hypothetical protein THITE_2114100 [Thermothielavioides terrestris NRRL 8126]
MQPVLGRVGMPNPHRRHQAIPQPAHPPLLRRRRPPSTATPMPTSSGLNHPTTRNRYGGAPSPSSPSF